MMLCIQKILLFWISDVVGWVAVNALPPMWYVSILIDTKALFCTVFPRKGKIAGVSSLHPKENDGIMRCGSG